MKLRPACAAVAALAISSGGLVLLVPGAASAATDGVVGKTRHVLDASGFGSTVTALDGVVRSGRTAAVGFGCTRQTSLDRSNEASGADLGALGTVGAATTHVTSSRAHGKVLTESTTDIADAFLLGGQIQVEGLHVVARTWHSSADGFQAETETTVGSLTIGGEEVDVLDRPQEISIPGVAMVVVNGSTTKERPHRADANAVALEITVLGGDGAKIMLGSATAGIDGRTYLGRLAGKGWGGKVEVTGTVEHDKSARKAMPCRGTNGKDRSSSTAAVDLGAIEVGAVRTTVRGDARVPYATVTNEVADVTVDLGLAELRIEGVVTQAHAELVGGEVVTDLGQSTVAAIVVDPVVGAPIDIPVDVAPETEISLPLGLGSITFFDAEPFKGDRGVKVAGLQIDLPMISSDITVGAARAAIRR